MTLHQFQELRGWHLRQARRRPLECHAWDAVVTLWVMGCVGAPAALLLHSQWAEALSMAALFVPGLYVALRRRLHRQRRLRCDWLAALL
jgi:Mn2+/Fe2+ NRAMP family transporter